MSETVIQLENVTVTYRILMNRTGSIKELFRDAIKGRVRILNYIALDNLTFSVKQGEVTAIIGRNGAGKSTLLKVIAGVLPPTSGSVNVKGSIAPMIELGAGFNYEMTGVENVIFYSALMGRDIKKVKSRVSEIGNWAGVSDHMTFPLRTYSSGMVARLAFSTATDEVADIVLIDEVLSVGDSEFQIKSRQRMAELISGGAAGILVSHDMGAVRLLADRAIWLEKGKIIMEGSATEVADAYEAN
jgi:ABC-type polysaccharide/polyol phosphate transport system ATPase subunit